MKMADQQNFDAGDGEDAHLDLGDLAVGRSRFSDRSSTPEHFHARPGWAWQAAWLQAGSLGMGVTMARFRRPSRAAEDADAARKDGLLARIRPPGRILRGG